MRMHTIETSEGSLKFDFDPSAVIIYGGGGLSKMIIETVRVLGIYTIVGIIDDALPAGSDVIGSPVLGGASELAKLRQNGIGMAVNSVGGIGNYAVRWRVFQSLAEAGFHCPSVVHPTAHIDPARAFPAVCSSSHTRQRQCQSRLRALINNSVNVCSNFSPGAKLAGDVIVDDLPRLV